MNKENNKYGLISNSGKIILVAVFDDIKKQITVTGKLRKTKNGIFPKKEKGC